MENAETCEKSWVHVNTHTKFIDLKKETLREKNLDRDFEKTEIQSERNELSHTCVQPLSPYVLFMSWCQIFGWMVSQWCRVLVVSQYEKHTDSKKEG